VLGHIQRGGSPTVLDRVNATLMGVRAVELLAEGKFNRLVSSKNGKIVDYDIDEGIEMKKHIDGKMYATGKIVSR
jgi:6-phosphofructokinase 1